LISSKTVKLEQLRNRKFASVLCYPRYSAAETAKRIEELRRLGVKTIEFAGEKTAFNLRILGKGYVGIVVIAHTATGRTALKIRRVDADRAGMEHEAEMLAKVNSIGIGPSFIGASDNFLLMELFQGQFLPDWVTSLKGRGSSARIRQVLRGVLEQCRKLDVLGLDHGELSRAQKHIIIDRDDNAHIVDFETASVDRRTSNVTSVCQYLFVGSQLAKTLRKRPNLESRSAIIRALRKYKLERSDRSFYEILQACKIEAA
jgi:putative serine/threonine protein kinase